MKRSLPLFVLFAAIATALVGAFAASCGNDGGPSLVGVWTGSEVGGGPEEWTFVLDGTDFAATAADTEAYEGTYIAHPDESPMRISLTVTDSVFPPHVGEEAHAIYRFDGDSLILAANEPGLAETPTGFTPGGGTRVWELTEQ